MDRLTQIIIYFLGPTSWLDYVWKVSLLASFATFGAVGIEALFGVDIASRLPIYLAITIGISVPFFSAAMLLVLRLLKLQKQLDYFARTDVLTGLDNRRAFFAQTDQMQGGALILLDVDHFKDVNDTYGHAVGDRALAAVAEYIRTTTRKTDLLARYGGEEFVVYLPDTDRPTAEQIAARLVLGVQVQTGGAEFQVTMSAGLAHVGAPLQLDAALKAADDALYAAKAAGRACFRSAAAEPMPLRVLPDQERAAGQSR